MTTSTATKAFRLASLLAGVTAAGIALKCAVADVFGGKATGTPAVGGSASTGPVVVKPPINTPECDAGEHGCH
ncbi:hypothetical protein ACFVHB_03460 [Kitasatospora sp. NPDC127111]|uniref:hypothetical protein n=1 Tax=Kitasatospora sp. NPDC127111 TaxID=3345363 RepID=UPI00362890EB